MSSAADAAGIAAELGISYDLFLRTRKELERRGFPRPLPLPTRGQKGRPPLRWSLEAVRDWIRNPVADAAPKAAPARLTQRDLRALQERLG